VSGSPIVGEPPYDQSALGNGGESSGEGSPRRAGAGEEAVVPDQSWRYDSAQGAKNLFSSARFGFGALGSESVGDQSVVLESDRPIGIRRIPTGRRSIDGGVNYSLNA
jgi:hypothetical protein